jgi:hypothetical protein
MNRWTTPSKESRTGKIRFPPNAQQSLLKLEMAPLLPTKFLSVLQAVSKLSRTVKFTTTK